MKYVQQELCVKTGSHFLFRNIFFDKCIEKLQYKNVTLCNLYKG